MPRKIKKRLPKIVQETPDVSATSTTSWYKNYPRIIGMFILLLFMPPLGWIFAYKFSPYDKKATILLSVVCTIFFAYAAFVSPMREWVDVSKMTSAGFCTRYNNQVTTLAPHLGLAIDETKLSDDGGNFTYEITNTLDISAQIENSYVKQVTVTATPKNTDDSFQALNCFGLVIATLSPELDQDKRGEVLRELGMLSKTISDDWDTSTDSGRITYGVENSAGKIIFTARINNDF